MRFLSAGLRLFIACSEGTKDLPDRDLKPRMLTLSEGVARLPDKLTYKQAYPIKGHSQEGPLFSQFVGQFGIADVIGYYVCGPNDSHGSTGPFFKGAEFWSVLEDEHRGGGGANQQNKPISGRREPEDRGLYCIALSAGGQALLDLRDEKKGTPSPGELLETILHAMIGA